jgi:hypothetical protein
MNKLDADVDIFSADNIENDGELEGIRLKFRYANPHIQQANAFNYCSKHLIQASTIDVRTPKSGQFRRFCM